jgi:D-lactate dehydrogenase
MKVAVYSIHNFERAFIEKANDNQHELKFIEHRLSLDTIHLAKGCEAVSIFTGDCANAEVLVELAKINVEFLALRSAGFNHVDINQANNLKIKVARVPEYSPYAIAEHALALMLGLNRKLIKVHNRIMDLNFSLDGLVGFDMNQKVVGVVGCGKIGSVLVKILHGLGCKILVHDLEHAQELVEKYNVEYTSYSNLCEKSDIITLHVPLNSKTRYIVDEESINRMKSGVMLINTSRGGLVNTKAVINALKKGHINSFGMDVYEEEAGLFFEDHSKQDLLQDDIIARLMTFKNVLITSHQAFLTSTALKNIAETTIQNLSCFDEKKPSGNEL